MIDFLTKENITFIIAVIGAFGSLYTWTISIINNRINLDVRPVEFHVGKNSLLMYAMISNNSKSAITICEFSVNISDIYIPAEKIPTIAFEYESRVADNVTKRIDYTLPFPISITGLSSVSGYIFFPFPEGLTAPSSNTFSFQICTSTNKVIEKTLSLNFRQ